MKGLKPLNKLLSLQIFSPMWIAENVSRCEIPSIKRNCWLLSLCSCLEREVSLGSHLGRDVWEDRCSLKTNPTELQGRTTPWFPDPEGTPALGAVFGGGGYQRVAQVQVPAVRHRLQAEQMSHVRGITPFASSLWGLKVSCGLWGPCSAWSYMDLSLSAASKGLWGERALGCKRQKKNWAAAVKYLMIEIFVFFLAKFSDLVAESGSDSAVYKGTFLSEMMYFCRVWSCRHAGVLQTRSGVYFCWPGGVVGLFTCVFAWISSATKLLSKLLSGCYELSPEAANSSLIPVVAGADLEVAVLGVEDQSPKVRMKVVLSFFFF